MGKRRGREEGREGGRFNIVLASRLNGRLHIFLQNCHVDHLMKFHITLMEK